MDKIYSYSKESAERFEYSGVFADRSADKDAKRIIIPQVKDGTDLSDYDKLLLDLIKTVEKGDRVFVDITGMPGPLVMVVMNVLTYGEKLHNTAEDSWYNVESIECDGKEITGLFYNQGIINGWGAQLSPRIIEMITRLND